MRGTGCGDRERVGDGVGLCFKGQIMYNVTTDKFILNPLCKYVCPACGEEKVVTYYYPHSFSMMWQNLEEQYCALCYTDMDLSYVKCKLELRSRLEMDNPYGI